LASPGFTHQDIHSNLYENLVLWFKGKSCRVLSAPFDVTLYNEETKSKNVVQLDLLVTCDHKEATDSNDRYMGIPALVIEILSLQTRSRDLVKKLNLYLEGGVNEYWVVDPREKQVILYYFIEKKLEQMITYKHSEVVESFYFKGWDIAVADIFGK
jgi:Uma2 family endonuclease